MPGSVYDKWRGRVDKARSRLTQRLGHKGAQECLGSQHDGGNRLSTKLVRIRCRGGFTV